MNILTKLHKEKDLKIIWLNKNAISIYQTIFQL